VSSRAEPAEVITSASNRRVTAVVRLHRKRGRIARGLTLLEGPNLLREAVIAGAPIRTVFGLPDDAEWQAAAVACGAQWLPVTSEVLRKMSTTPEPQSPVAIVAIPDDPLPEHGSLLTAWGVNDPGNTGTMVRTAAAFGLGFAAGPGTADLWSPKVLRSAAGSHWRARVGIAPDLGALKSDGRVLVATVVTGGEDPSVLGDVPIAALLIGGETHGLPDEIVQGADLRVTIPMPGGTESLNAAMAGAILAYELSRGASGGSPAAD